MSFVSIKNYFVKIILRMILKIGSLFELLQRIWSLLKKITEALIAVETIERLFVIIMEIEFHMLRDIN